MSQADDIKRALYEKRFLYGGFALVVLLLLPVLFDVALLAAKTAGLAAAAAVATGATAIICIALVNLLPVAAMKFANWRMKLLKAEAEKNPIETMENELLQINTEIEKFSEVLAKRKAAVRTFEQQITELRKTDEEGAAEFDQELQDLATEIHSHELTLRDDVIARDEFKDFIEKMKRRWAVALTGDALRDARPKQRDKALREMLVKHSADAVRSRANQASARLNVDALMARTQEEYKVNKAVVYDNLGTASINTVEVDALMVVNDYKGKTMKERLLALRECAKENATDLAETPGHHASWRSVNMERTEPPKWPVYGN